MTQEQPLSTTLPEGVNREDILTTPSNNIETGADSAEEAKRALSDIKTATHEKALAASEAEISDKEAELLKDLETQYPTMRAALERYEISIDGMPTWEQVKRGLTPEVLNKALKLAKPALLLVPPTSRQSKVEAIDKHPMIVQDYDTYAGEIDDDNLWNGGKSITENKWRAVIVEGIWNVAQDEQIYNGGRNNYQMSKLWVGKYKAQGLDVINDADTYLTLMMKAFVEGRFIDRNTFTVLNGKNMTETSGIATGSWADHQVVLFVHESDFGYPSLCLRGLVNIDVPEAA